MPEFPITMRSQRTIKNEVSFEGIGLHTGRHAKVTLRPAARDTGITFIRSDKNTVIKAHVGAVIDTAFATTIGHDGVKIRTVEHIMAALAGLGIDNIFVDVEGPEIPILDGSSTELISIILKAGIAKQGKKRPYIRIKRPVVFDDGNSKVAALPYEGRRFTYSIFFNHYGFGEQRLSIEINEETFAREIAPARTFGFLKDIEYLRTNGLAKGGSLENAIILGEKGVLNSSGLRFKDEFVRHKVLDSVGDLAILGFPIYGHIVANRSGHSANIKFLKKLLASPDAWDMILEEPVRVSPLLQINT
ncbi:UDP-3-O-(3-hydroxymyristoyl) N-acetylglucosamine deacetylase [Candidatus Sulfobium mesophilum]|uniref:UDP-3-O-acyl-N-acetylglucosamine deacetylase n=1 Tax=Candidatus Sulfobium mesophilum TaxID=2016548 RepID=A0A2U3QGK4_9BACT|nr:UDP-3-O-(3-hydroxymyristoyl) N-acetylglucosamine deacetylase [Candidatus Sulfobium mesophilum]